MSHGIPSGEHWLCLCESLAEYGHILILNFVFFFLFLSLNPESLFLMKLVTELNSVICNSPVLKKLCAKM